MLRPVRWWNSSVAFLGELLPSNLNAQHWGSLTLITVTFLGAKGLVFVALGYVLREVAARVYVCVCVTLSKGPKKISAM